MTREAIPEAGSGEAAGDERLRLQVSEPLSFTSPPLSEVQTKVSSVLPAVQPSSHVAVQLSLKPNDAWQVPVECRRFSERRAQVCCSHFSEPLSATLSCFDVSSVHRKMLFVG
jgi:hypothetical protein